MMSWSRARRLQELVRSFSTAVRQTRFEAESWSTLAQLEEQLSDRIIFQDHNIVVLDKPNGLPMHALKYTEGLSPDVQPLTTEGFSVAACLPGLAKKLEIAQLVPTYSQNRLYSGIIVLAKHEESARMLQKYFRHTRAQKVPYQNYWALTLGVPEEKSGVMEMSVRRQDLHEWRVSVFEDQISKRQRHSRERMQPRVLHKVLDTNPRFDTALIEVTPTASKWDLLQLYLSHILTPALGDHIYSSRVTRVMDRRMPVHPQSAYPKPQVVPPGVLEKLECEGKSTVSIPLHIHCHSLTLPVMVRRHRGTVSQTKTLTADLPPFFLHSLKQLGLRHPQHV